MADQAAEDREVDDGTDKRPTFETGGRVGEDDDEHQQALERLQLSAEAFNKQATRERNALRFQVPELQWTKDALEARAGQQIDNITIPPRPHVSIPKIDQAIQLVLNQERAAHLGVTVHPLDERATNQTAEKITGIYRSIERESRAGLARSWAFERAVKAGRGAWRVLTKPAYNFQETGDQDIAIGRLLYQESAYFDPFAQEPDWCDGEWGFVLEWVNFAKYQRYHKNIKNKPGAEQRAIDLPSKLAELSDGELTKLQETCPDWIRGDGEARAVLIGEYMKLEDRPEGKGRAAIRLAAAQGWRKGEYKRVAWRRLNAIEFMEYGRQHFRYIPIIPAIGRELIPFDDERRWQGMYEPNIDGQRTFNYAASTAIESMAQEPKSTWMLAEGQEKGHEREMLLANVRNFPYTRYRPVTFEGQLVPPPTRTQIDTSKLGLSIQMLAMAGEWIHAGTFVPDAALGNASPNSRTKGGTLALQQQSEAANSNWLDNQAELSMTYEAKVVLSGIPYYYDRPGRVAMILGREDKDAKMIMLNRPFKMAGGRPQAVPYRTPEEQQAARAAAADPNDPTEFYDLLEGQYGTTVQIGKGYKSRVDQGADELGQLFQAEPELFKILGDIYLRFRDFPGHEEAAERIKKLLPPQLQEQGADQDPKLQLEQAKQALQQMQARLQELEPEKMKAETQRLVAKLKSDTDKALKIADVHLQAMKDATSMAVAKINAQAKGVQIDQQAEDEAIALGREHAYAEQEANRDRAHQLALQALGAGAAAQQSDTEHAQGLEAGAVEHGQAQELSGQEAAQAAAATDQQAGIASQAADQAQGHTLEAAQQAADLAPPPADTGE